MEFQAVGAALQQSARRRCALTWSSSTPGKGSTRGCSQSVPRPSQPTTRAQWSPPTSGCILTSSAYSLLQKGRYVAKVFICFFYLISKIPRHLPRTMSSSSHSRRGRRRTAWDSAASTGLVSLLRQCGRLQFYSLLVKRIWYCLHHNTVYHLGDLMLVLRYDEFVSVVVRFVFLEFKWVVFCSRWHNVCTVQVQREFCHCRSGGIGQFLAVRVVEAILLLFTCLITIYYHLPPPQVQTWVWWEAVWGSAVVQL